MNCIECGCEISPPKKKFCSRNHAQRWRAKNVYGNEYTNSYRASHPRRYLMGLAKKKSERRNLDADALYALYLEQEGKCALTGFEMTHILGEGRVPTNMSIDRKDSTVGYEIENIQLVCIQANKMKSELSTEELVEWATALVDKLKPKGSK